MLSGKKCRYFNLVLTMFTEKSVKFWVLKLFEEKWLLEKLNLIAQIDARRRVRSAHTALLLWVSNNQITKQLAIFKSHFIRT